MLELASMNALKAAEADPSKTAAEKQSLAVAKVVFITLYIVLLAWALKRALKCSSATPDSRAIHLGFALISPAIYIIFSYLVPGFCERM
jgi:hypothetical protein